MMFQRILLKISVEALSAAGEPLCNQTIDRTADRIAALHARGVEIGVVCGGGNIIRGRDAGAHDRNRTDAARVKCHTRCRGNAARRALRGFGSTVREPRMRLPHEKF